MKDVFLSFQTGDDDIARQAAEFLERRGWSCWRCTSPADNVPGADWTRTVAEALMAAEAVLLLYSGRAAESRHVFREISMAVGAEKTVLVVCLDNTPFSPAWIYLVRTMQMLNAQRQAPVDWLPAVADALRVLLPSQCVLPIDSIADRRFKVRFCRELHRELFGDQRVRMLGAAVQLPGVVRLHIAHPRRTAQQVSAVAQALTALTEMRPTAPAWSCVPFRASEDVFFLVCFAGTKVGEKRALQLFRRLQRMLDQAIGGSRDVAGNSGILLAKVRTLSAMYWDPGDGEENLAGFFADLGGELSGPGQPPRKGPAPPCRQGRLLDEPGERLLARVAAASARMAGASPVAQLGLQKAMTIMAADERLRQIFSEG